MAKPARDCKIFVMGLTIFIICVKLFNMTEKRGRGRPLIGRVSKTFRLDPPLVAELKAAAARDGREMSSIVRAGLRIELARMRRRAQVKEAAT